MTSTSPIHSLPNELLEIVFEIGSYTLAPKDANYPHRPLFSKNQLHHLFPTAVSQICRRWRELALQMPIMWTSIQISRSADAHRRLRSEIGHSLDWMPLYLRRSCGLPLHITIDFTRMPINSLMNRVASESRRWRSLVILVTHVGNLPLILQAMEHIMVPQLRTLTIQADIYREGILSAETIPSFFTPGSPQLSTVRLQGVYISWNGPPLLNLTTLELRLSTRWPSLNKLREMLNASPLLKYLTIQDDIAALLRHMEEAESPPQTQASVTITLPNLLYLEVEVHRIRQSKADVAGFLATFSTPNLATLVLRGLKSREWHDVNDSFTRRSTSPNFPRIRKLVLSDIEGMIEFGSKICRAFPFVTQLFLARLHSNGFIEAMIEDGKANMRNVPAWPYLRHLAIRDDDRFSVTLLHQALHHRRILGRSSSRLEVVLYNICTPTDKARIVEIRKLASLTVKND